MKKPLLWQFEEVTRVVLLKMCYVELTGDLVTGLLLSQIVYWYKPDRLGNSKLYIQRDGRWWIAKSREEWRSDIGVSIKQFDRAIDQLALMGVVHRRLFKFGGRPIPHVSLDVDKLSLLLKKVADGLSQKGKVEFPKKAKSTLPKGQNHIVVKTTGKTTAETQDSGSKKAPALNEGEKIMKAEEHLKKFLDKHKPAAGFPDAMPVKNTMQLATMWERLLPYYNDIEFIKALTKKEIGQLGKFRKAVGDQGAYAAMKYALQHWQKFLIDIADDTGDTLSSKSPQVGLLLKHYNVAMAGAKKQTSVKPAIGGLKVLSKQDKAAMTK